MPYYKTGLEAEVDCDSNTHPLLASTHVFIFTIYKTVPSSEKMWLCVKERKKKRGEFEFKPKQQ